MKALIFWVFLVFPALAADTLFWAQEGAGEGDRFGVIKDGPQSLKFNSTPSGLSTFMTASNIDYGNQIIFYYDGILTDFVFYKGSTDTITARSLRLWSIGSPGSQVTSCSTSSEPTGTAQWIDCPLSTPFVVGSGDNYIVSVDNPVGGIISFAATTDCLNMGTPPGLNCVTSVNSNNAGFVYPSTNQNGTIYVDVVFQPL